MARLPDANVLGGLDNLNSRRPIATYDDSAIARGDAAAAEAIGQGVGNLGKGLVSIGGSFADIEVRKQTAERTQARAEMLAAKVDLDSQFSKDTNYKDMPSRYEKELNGLTEKAAGLLSTPGNKQRFLDEIKPTVRHGVASIVSRARTLEAETNVGYTLERGVKLQNAALSSDDPAVRNQAIQSYNDQVDSLVLRGFRTPAQALAMKQDFAHQYAVASTAQKIDTDPAAVVTELSNPSGSIYEFMRPAEREQLLRQARQGVVQQKTKDAYSQGEFYERQIIDFNAGRTTLPDRAQIENDPILDEPRRNVILRQHDAAAAAGVQFQQFAQKFADPNGGPFNPFDKADQDGIDKTYQMLGGGMPALQKIVDRTNIIPKSAVVQMRGDLVSGDVKRVAGALQLASSLRSRNDNILTAGVSGGEDIDKAVTRFEHDVAHLGFTPEQAARRYVESQTPEYKEKVERRNKNENLNEIIKKNTSVDDIRSRYDTWFSFAPAAGFTPEAKDAMTGDYQGLVRQFYLEGSPIEEAKELALKQLGRVWGVSKVSGNDTVMRYPPETAPAYRGIENVSDQVAEQAIADIKAEYGIDVKREHLRLDPIPRGQLTAAQHQSGMEPRYLLSWKKPGEPEQTFLPGRGFYASRDTMLAAQSAKREAAVKAAREKLDAFERDVQDFQSDPMNAPINPRVRQPPAATIEQAGRSAAQSKRGEFDRAVEEQQSYPENAPINLRPSSGSRLPK